METKKSNLTSLIIFLLSIILISSFSSVLNQNLNNSKNSDIKSSALQDDEDLEVTLHCILESDSSEILSRLMSTGTYTFYDTPDLDIGTYSHDLTEIKIEKLQKLIFNSTIPQTHYNSSVSSQTNLTTDSNPIKEYWLSAPRDTFLELYINYTTADEEFIYEKWKNVDSTFQVITDIYYHETENIFYTVDVGNNEPLETYDTDLNHISTIALNYGYKEAIWYKDGYWYILNQAERVYKLDNSWNYISDYDLSSEDSEMKDILFNGTNWLAVGKNTDKIYVYDSNFNYLGINYDTLLGSPGGMCFDEEGEYYWITDYEYIHRYYKNFTYSNFRLDINRGGESACFYKNNDSVKLLTTHSWSFSPYDRIYMFKYDLGFDNAYVNNFTYEFLGIDYNETYELNLKSKETGYHNVNMTFYFDSSFFSQYDYINDVKVLKQHMNINLTTSLSCAQLNYTYYFNYSNSQKKVPTEVSLKINGVEAIDETIDSGIVSLTAFPETLIITADYTVYFELNITVDFTFTIDLEIISKTYLKNHFKLLSDHSIFIERLDLPDFDIKKIYLNNIDLGNLNPNSLSPSVEFSQYQIFKLEVLLASEIYIPLQYIRNSLGLGTTSLFFSGITNTLNFQNYNRFNDYIFEIPIGFNPEYANLSFDNIRYTPDYTSNNSYNTNGINVETQNPIDPTLTYSNSSENMDFNKTLTQTQIPTNQSFSFTNGTITQNGTLMTKDIDYSQFNSTQSGHYPGTYSFENEIGETGTSIAWVDSASIPNSCEIEIISEIDNHKNILKFTHDGGASDPSMQHNFASIQTSGTIEFWWGTDDNTNRQQFSIYGASSHGPKLYIESNKFQYWDSAGYQNTGITATNDVLFHHKIIFDCDTDTFDWYIDSVIVVNDGSFDGVSDGLNKQYARLSTNAAYSSYFDALGYSWDSYDVGDNYHWQSYRGSETFENYNISEPGNYYGSPDNFNDETVGTTGTSIAFIDSCSTTANTEIITEWQGHKNILKQTNVGGSDYLVHNIAQATSGTVEFWWGTDDKTLNAYIQLNDGGTNCIYIKVTGEDLQFRANGGGYNKIIDVVDDTIYHIKIVWRSDNTADIYADGVKEIDNLAIYNTQASGIDKFIINVENHACYLDAWGEVSDADYDVGDNYNPYGKQVISDLESDGWNITNNPYTSVGISGDFDIHKKALELYDNNTSGFATISNTFPSAQENGTIEFWIRLTANHAYIELQNSAGTRAIWGNITAGDKFYFGGGTGWQNTAGCTADTWYHFKFVFDNSDDEIKIYLDGILIQTHTYLNSMDIQRVFFSSHLATSGYYINIDALSYSWEDDIGYNLLATNMPTLNITLDIDFTPYLYEYLDYIQILYSYSVSIYQNISFYIYDFNSNSFILFDNNFSGEFWNNNHSINSNPINYFNGSNYNLYFKIYAQNISSDFSLFLDMFKAKIRYFENKINMTPSLAVIFQNYVFVNESFNITLGVSKSFYDIDYILFYDNITGINRTIGRSEGNYNITLSFSQSLYYSVWFFVNDTHGSWRKINITNLFVHKIACYIDIFNLKSQYNQNSSVLVNVTLRDCFNNLLTNQNINLILTNQSNSIINQSSLTTNSFGSILFYFNANYSHLGFYHLNFSFYSNIYLNNSKMMSFEITPLERDVNCSDIHLTINSLNVLNDNFIQINHTSNFTIDCLDNSTFDLQIRFCLNYTENITYNQYLEYEFEFEASSDINYLLIKHANLSNSPTNFTSYYFNNVYSTDYLLFGSNFQISELINDVFYDQSEFKIELNYYTDSIYRKQISAAPRTDADSVIFTENLRSNRTFSYWYFSNSLTINSVSLNHVRTATIINTFDINNSKYYFDESALNNDVFIATVDYNPNWEISYETLENNGTYTKIKITYKADLEISNVSLVLDLENDGIYNDNWSLNADQSIFNYKLIIPLINFTTTEQTIYIDGYSAVPISEFDCYKNEKKFEISDEDYNDLNEYFEAYLDFYKYSQIWIIGNVDDDWKLDGIHYNNKDIDINSDYLFTCSGYGTSITSAYLRIKTNPISSWDRVQTDSYVEYTIDCNLPFKNIDFKFYISSTQRVQITGVELDTEYLDLIEYYSADDKDYFKFLRLDLEEGVNVIKIKYKVLSLSEASWLLLAAAAAIIGLVIMYYETKDGEFINKIKFWKKKNERMER